MTTQHSAAAESHGSDVIPTSVGQLTKFCTTYLTAVTPQS